METAYTKTTCSTRRNILKQFHSTCEQDAKSGRTALHFAVDTTSPSPSIIATLLRHPLLHIDTTNFAQQTALELAWGRNHLDLVDLLHVHGADWPNRIHGYYSSDSFSEDDMVISKSTLQSESVISVTMLIYTVQNKKKKRIFDLL